MPSKFAITLKKWWHFTKNGVSVTLKAHDESLIITVIRTATLSAVRTVSCFCLWHVGVSVWKRSKVCSASCERHRMLRPPQVTRSDVEDKQLCSEAHPEDWAPGLSPPCGPTTCRRSHRGPGGSKSKSLCGPSSRTFCFPAYSLLYLW